MREHVDLSEKEKLEQLHAMVVNSSWLDDDKPCEEFRELLSSLPVETVIVFPRTPYLMTPLQFQSRSFLHNIPLFPRWAPHVLKRGDFPSARCCRSYWDQNPNKKSRDRKYQLLWGPLKTQVAVAADNKGVVSLLLEKGFDECFHFKSLNPDKILFSVS